MNVFTNLKPVNCVNKSISLLLTADSVSLSFGSGLKKFKISTLKELQKLSKAYFCYVIFIFFLFKKIPFFCITL